MTKARRIDIARPSLAESIDRIAACLWLGEEIEFDLASLVDVTLQSPERLSPELASRSHELCHAHVRLDAASSTYICRWGSSELFDDLASLKCRIEADIELLREVCLDAVWPKELVGRGRLTPRNLVDARLCLVVAA